MSTTSKELKKAVGLARAGKREKAAQIVRDILTQVPDNTEALWYLGNMSPDINERYAALKRLLEHDPWHEKAQDKVKRMEADEALMFMLDDQMPDWFDKPKKGEKRKNEEERVPGWSWLFVVICGAIPIITLGGLIPVLIGIGGATACRRIAKSRNVNIFVRVFACIAVSFVAWLLLILFIGGLALLVGEF